MLTRLKLVQQLLTNMGFRYLLFRVYYELMRKTGILKWKFPKNPKFKKYYRLQDWKKQPQQFFFKSKQALSFPKDPHPGLEQEYFNYKKGIVRYFSSTDYAIGTNYDWLTNPDNGYCYDVNLHWTQINDFSNEAGDIKYVWEKSRFSFLYLLIRYDYHFDKDCSKEVFDEILSWIEANPINAGPNYKCSQEISLRVLNWIFALHYYKESVYLTEAIFDKIQFAIYWQIKHVYANINFSRIAVRNNHAITETLALYLVGMLMPAYPDADKWKLKGKKWFEEEIAYQVYQDGTFLQFSMNYHRVVVQLLTWAIELNVKNDNPFAEVVYERAKASLNFLTRCLNSKDGMLPNYGANDGALFFKLNQSDYSDFRPQLQALAAALSIPTPYVAEDVNWYGISANLNGNQVDINALAAFQVGGYYVMSDAESLTFIRCGKHKNRPSHADNLHVDIWAAGENILRDAGTYKYNTSVENVNYFAGALGHNTISIDRLPQMRKGPRFIWLDWSQASNAQLLEDTESYTFEGKINAFLYLDKQITHHRKIKKLKNQLKWEIEDRVTAKGEHEIEQIWNPSPNFHDKFELKAFDESGKQLEATTERGWFSRYYGQKEQVDILMFKTRNRYIKTIIQLK